MTTFLLIRHAAHGAQGVRLVGRMPDAGLSVLGREQADRLARRLERSPIEAVCSSPMERAMATARAIADRRGITPRIEHALDEIDFGTWTGQSFAELASDPVWQAWNGFRSASRPPGGEAMIEVQARAVELIERLRHEHGDGTVALVSHADVIRAVLVHFLGMPLDLILRLEVEPGSVSILSVADWGARLLGLNDTGGMPAG